MKFLILFYERQYAHARIVDIVRIVFIYLFIFFFIALFSGKKRKTPTFFSKQ